jgi:ATP-dependent Lon protease
MYARPRIDLTELFLSEDIGRRFEQGAMGRGTHQLYEVDDRISQSSYAARAGDKRVVSDASLAFMGNVSVERQEGGYVPVEDLTYVLPEPMRDSAFIDRLHGLLPGWELPKISQSKVHLSKGYGIASDFFAEVLHQMRKESLAGLVGKHVSFSSSFTIRDEKSVKRVSSGLLKLLFPDKSFGRKELELVAGLALELRQRVRDWLHKVAPGEFPREKLSVEIHS